MKNVFKAPIHPAAELFPELPEDELRDLADDIKKNGLLEPIIMEGGMVLDGRNPLLACKLAGVDPKFNPYDHDEVDPYDFVLSRNLHRRHLTASQRRKIIAAVLKHKPEKSNRQVAEQTKTDHKTVGTVRDELERTGEIPHMEKHEDAKGVERPAKKRTPEQQALIDGLAIYSPEPETEQEKKPESNGEIKVQGVGVIRAKEAINCLLRIPKNDALRKRGFQIVTDWIRRNR